MFKYSCVCIFSRFSLHFFFAASSGVSSLHSWFPRNCLILNPTKTEAICFGTSPLLKSLSNRFPLRLHVHLFIGIDYVKLLSVTFDSHRLKFDKHISNVCSSSYFHIRALRHICPFLNSETLYCRFQIRLCQFLPAFLLVISIVFSAFKTPWLESLFAQLPTPLQL